MTIEINTKLPKKDKKPESSQTSGQPSGQSSESGEGDAKTTYEFQLPATLLE